MSTNLLIQYTLVGLCIAAACVWILVKVFLKSKKNPGCGSCSLANICEKPEKNTQSDEPRDCGKNQ